MICPICARDLGEIRIEEHHLIPKTFGGKEKVRIHKMCHQKLHATFSEREMEKHYHTVERLIEHEEMQKFIKWVRKQPLDFYDKNDDTEARKRRR